MPRAQPSAMSPASSVTLWWPLVSDPILPRENDGGGLRLNQRNKSIGDGEKLQPASQRCPGPVAGTVGSVRYKRAARAADLEVER